MSEEIKAAFEEWWGQCASPFSKEKAFVAFAKGWHRASREKPKTNTLIVIGWTGIQRAYLNVPRDEAIRRYRASEDQPEDVWDKASLGYIEEFTFKDEFGTYSAWAIPGPDIKHT